MATGKRTNNNRQNTIHRKPSVGGLLKI